MIRRFHAHAFVSVVALAGVVPPVAAQGSPVLSGLSGLLHASDASAASMCGGVGATGTWAGGDASSSDLASVAAAFEADGQVPAGGRLVRLFFLGSRTDVRLEAAGRPAGDPALTLFDAEGREVASDDDSGGDLAARVETTLDPGAYCVAVRAYDGEPVDVAVRLGRAEHEAMTDGAGGGFACSAPDLARLGDASVDAAALEAGVSGIATVGQTPAWGFTLAEAAALTITATSGSGDPLVRLRDADGAVLAENDDADGTNSRIDVPGALAAGDYCLEMEDLAGADNPVQVTLARFDPAADRARRIAAAEFSPLADDDVAVQSMGTLGSSTVIDVAASATASWLRFDVPEEGVIALEAIGQGVDPIVALFDRVGRRVGENDDGPNGLDSLLVQRVRAGEYLMAVRLAGGGSAGNVRLLLERYVPAAE